MSENIAIGDKVAVLDEAIEGEVIAIKNTEISIKTNDDFVMTFFVNELVKINNTNKLDNLFSAKSLSEVLKDKKEPEKRNKKEEFVLEIDLHIEKLVPHFRGMSNFDILNIQMDTVKHKLEFAIKNRLPKLVFIHGVGEGVLKSEIEFFLGRYDQVIFQEANFQKYGFGATEVYIKQNPNR
jgi:ABC-type proline/glycine betaine transport system ATPase subunit